ncbi:unnamed protein product [Pleuronectes platessa]|uniref:Uncharacterized protein n=1 Tax=Pleuronectes platessa TaxID=8262 RepID=A0A9N7Y653_PLEPL|nr:unnamed protein product [Pleuronectes platessa]
MSFSKSDSDPWAHPQTYRDILLRDLTEAGAAAAAPESALTAAPADSLTSSQHSALLPPTQLRWLHLWP